MPTTKGERIPRERSETVRQSIEAALRDNELTARELSVLCSIKERDVAEHLEHLGRSLPAKGERLIAEPARCALCDFRFEGRRRATRPSRCPKCKSERIRPATFRIEAD
jgi:predicted Zn-ribbon and HTH transcriptional regulator